MVEKKALTTSTEIRKSWVTLSASLSINRQCVLAGVPRASYYYDPVAETPENLAMMRLLDKEYTRHPFYGSRRMAVWLTAHGHPANRKRVQRLMRLMGLHAIYAKPHLSVAHKEHDKYPYLLNNVVITRPNQVWSTDITYLRMRGGFLYLVAVIDWYSRYVLAWRISNTLDSSFCIEALEEALLQGRPDIFNTDQGVQFTSKLYTQKLKDHNIQISMDGRGRALDNIFIERLWRTVKYEEIYLQDYETVSSAIASLNRYREFYNNERPHQSLGYKTPHEVHHGLVTLH